MAILYNKVERGNPLNKSTEKKWYITLKVISQTGEKEVAQLLADETTLNPKEAELALNQFKKILIRLLLDGHSVQLGDWGSFHLTCNSIGGDSKTDISARSIKNLNIRFTAGTELKEAIKEASFISAETLQKK